MALAVLMAATTIPARADEDDGEPSWSDKIGNTLKNSIGDAAGKIGIGRPPDPPQKESPSGCPSIAIQDGTTAQRILAPGTTDNAGVRYQFSLYHVGRECNSNGGAMTVKVGGDGRVLLGPAGAAGHFDVPIRIVIFSEVEQKPVESRLYKVPASINAGQAATPFTFVSDALPVPISSTHSGTDFSIKVGIDTGKAGGDVKPTKARHRKANTASASQ